MQDAKPQNPPTIMVVDPNSERREHISGMLEGLGYDSLPVRDLELAFDLIDHGGAGASLVLCPIDIIDEPEKFALTLLEMDTSLPFIAYGDNRDERTAVQCLSAGADDFIQCPVTPEVLVASVASALERREQRRKQAKSDSLGAISAMSPASGWVELTAPSELEHMRRMQLFSENLFASRLPKQVCEDLSLAMEEVGRNAVEWGNRFNPDKHVTISYCIFRDRIVLKFEDEGEGFTPSEVPNPTLDPQAHVEFRKAQGKRPGGYGLFMLQRLMDDVTFNEKGNVVVMTKFFR